MKKINSMIIKRFSKNINIYTVFNLKHNSIREFIYYINFNDCILIEKRLFHKEREKFLSDMNNELKYFYQNFDLKEYKAYYNISLNKLIKKDYQYCNFLNK